MSEEDIRNYLSRQSTAPPASQRVRVVRRPARPQAPAHAEPETFRDFSATHLFCPRCRQAMPVRERLLLYLPEGDLYDYACEGCGTSTGTRKVGRSVR